MVRDAGFEPGAVLPSTLAVCAGLPEIEAATLVVNAGESSVTTAIVQGGVLLLHRTVELALDEAMEAEMAELGTPLPLVDVESSAGEWAMQQPLNGYGVLDDDHINAQLEGLDDEGRVSRENMLPELPATASGWEARRLRAAGREITQALSVAAAYFEDTLQQPPGVVLSAGTIDAGVLGELLLAAGFDEAEMRVREMVEPGMLGGGAVSSRVPRGWMAGVRGALRG
jgi:type IV pilus assembly protein PilM